MFSRFLEAISSFWDLEGRSEVFWEAEFCSVSLFVSPGTLLEKEWFKRSSTQVLVYFSFDQ